MTLDNYKLILARCFKYYVPETNKILYRMLIGDVPEIRPDDRLYIEVETLAGATINTVRIEPNMTISKIKSILIEKNPTFTRGKLCLFDSSKPRDNREPLDNLYKITTNMKIIVVHSDVPYDWKDIVISKKHRNNICLTPRGFVTKNPSEPRQMVYYNKKGKKIGTYVPGCNSQIITGNVILKVNSPHKQFYNLSTKKTLYVTSASVYVYAVSHNGKYICIAESKPLHRLVIMDVGSGETTEHTSMFGSHKLATRGENISVVFNASAISNDGKLIAISMIGVRTNRNYPTRYVPQTYIINNGKYVRLTYNPRNILFGYMEINATNMYFSSNNKYLIVHGHSCNNHTGALIGNGIFTHQLNKYHDYGTVTQLIPTVNARDLTTKGDYLAYIDKISGTRSMGIILRNIETNNVYSRPFTLKQSIFLHLTKGGKALIIGSLNKLEVYEIDNWIGICLAYNDDDVEVDLNALF